MKASEQQVLMPVATVQRCVVACRGRASPVARRSGIVGEPCREQDLVVAQLEHATDTDAQPSPACQRADPAPA